jgi:hypothetical protein
MTEMDASKPNLKIKAHQISNIKKCHLSNRILVVKAITITHNNPKDTRNGIESILLSTPSQLTRLPMIGYPKTARAKISAPHWAEMVCARSRGREQSLMPS